ncbi:MAG: hypothetical protein M3Q99_15335 [Acidobacteriota bacterium]|nr:hypothetical protein [Acidobacteriota bacterium]
MKNLIKSGLLLFIFLISAQIGYSCSCFRIDNKEEVKTTEFIFVGKVVKINEDKTYVPPKLANVSPFLQKMIDTRKRFLIKFKIENKFKGIKENEITLVKYEQENSPCEGLSFEKEKTYLIYANKDKEDEEMSDNGLCSRTQNFDKKSEDYKELLSLKTKRKIKTTK